MREGPGRRRRVDAEGGAGDADGENDAIGDEGAGEDGDPGDRAGLI